MRKFLMLTTVALLGSTGLAMAQETLATDNAFGVPEVQEDNMLIVLPLVTATADGVVEIRGIAGEQDGVVLGSQPVTAGANENVRVTLLMAPVADAVQAVLVVDGLDVATQEVELSNVGGSDADSGEEEDGDNEGEAGGSGDGDDSPSRTGDDAGDDAGGDGGDDAGGDDAGGDDSGG